MQTPYAVSFALFAVVALAACEANTTSSPGALPGIPTPPAPTATATGAGPAPTMMPGSTAPAPDAKSWGPAVEISNSAFSNLRGSPRVGIDATGSAVAVWLEELGDNTRNAIWSSRYSAGGAWSTPVTIDKPVGNPTPPQLAMTPSGTAVVVFGESASNQGGTEYLVTNRFTGTWGTAATISTPDLGSVNPFVALGPDAAATVVFGAADAVFPRAWAARSSAAGVWDAPKVMESNAEAGWAPSITIAANGDAVMTWTETGGGPSDTSLWASRNRAGVWGAPVLLSPDNGQVLNGIVVAADAGGNTLAIWSQRVAGLYTLRSARMTAATGAWSAPVTVNDGMQEVTAPQLGVDADGDAVAVWAETNHGVVASRFLASTATWGSPVVIQAHTTGVSDFPVPTVGLDAKGNAVAAWVQQVGGTPRPHLFAAHLPSAGGTWSAPVDLLADANAVAYAAEMQVSVNANGEAVVVWVEETITPAAKGIWARVYR